MMKLLCLCLLFANTALLEAQPEVLLRVETLLPRSKCKVDVMEVAYPKRFQELTLKMQTVLATNKDWWLNYIKENAKTGEPLPYNEKFGLTKGEYDEFLSLGEKRELQKFETAELTVTTNANLFEFHTDGILPDLEAVKIHLHDLAIETPFGTLTNPAPTEYEGGGPIGPYTGYHWEFEMDDKDFNNITSASFLVGKAKKSGRNFIYYKGGIVREKSSVKDTRVFIYYDSSKS